MALGSSFPLSFVLTAVDRLTGPLSGIEGKLGRIGAKATSVGKKLALGVSLPLAATGAAVIGTAASFEESMLNVQALSGATGKEFDTLRDQAKDLGSTTMFTASQAAQGQATLSLAGLDANKVLTATPQILEFAAAANLEFADAAGIAVTVMKGQGKGAEDLTDITDVLIQAQRKSFNTVGELNEAFTLAGPIAKGMGIEFKETAATLALLGDRGFKASLGGTALRGALTKLALPSREARGIFARLDLRREDLLDASGNVLGFVNTIEKLESSGATASDMLAIFGQRAGPGMASLVGAGSEALRDMLGELDRAGGTTTELATIRMKGATGSMRGFRSAVEGLAIAIGDSGILEWFTDTTKALTEWIRGLADSNPVVLRWGVIIAGTLAVLGPTLIVVGALTSAVGFLTAGIALLFSPVTLVVAGIAALVAVGVALVRNWEHIAEFGGRVKGVLLDGVGAAVAFVTRQIDRLVSIVPDWLVDFFRGDTRPTLEISGSGAVVGGSIARGAELGAAGAFEGVERTERRESSVRVDFANLPAGATVRQDGDDVPLDLTLGYSLAVQ